MATSPEAQIGGSLGVTAVCTLETLIETPCLKTPRQQRWGRVLGEGR